MAFSTKGAVLFFHAGNASGRDAQLLRHSIGTCIMLSSQVIEALKEHHREDTQLYNNLMAQWSHPQSLIPKKTHDMPSA